MRKERVTAEDLERLKHGYELYATGQWDSLAELMSPDIVMERDGGAGTVQGFKALRRFWEPDAFEYQKVEPLEFTPSGNKVLVRARIVTRGAGSGVELDMIGWHVWTVGDDGRTVHFLTSFDEATARDAAGLGQNASS